MDKITINVADKTVSIQPAVEVVPGSKYATFLADSVDIHQSNIDTLQQQLVDENTRHDELVANFNAQITTETEALTDKQNKLDDVKAKLGADIVPAKEAPLKDIPLDSPVDMASSTPTR